MELAWHSGAGGRRAASVLNDETGTLWIINAREIVVQWSEGSM
jgi:hypothetical protein